MRSPGDGAVPLGVLGPVLRRDDVSAGCVAAWAVLVAYYWRGEPDRTVGQLGVDLSHGAGRVEELIVELAVAELAVAELVAAGLVDVHDVPGGQRTVSVRTRFLGEPTT